MTDGATSKVKSLWTETDGAVRALREEAEREAKLAHIKASLVRCPVCKGEAEMVRFGLRGRGIWIGCFRTEECSRYIEIHTGGWSIEDTARDWNRRNRGIRKWIRSLKRCLFNSFGRRKRAERRYERELEQKKEAEAAKRLEIFGISTPKGKKTWWRFGNKGNK